MNAIVKIESLNLIIAGQEVAVPQIPALTYPLEALGGKKKVYQTIKLADGRVLTIAIDVEVEQLSKLARGRVSEDSPYGVTSVIFYPNLGSVAECGDAKGERVKIEGS